MVIFFPISIFFKISSKRLKVHCTQSRQYNFQTHSNGFVFFLLLMIQVVFEGIVGPSYRGDIAIDDVSVTRDPSCALHPVTADPRQPTQPPTPMPRLPRKLTRLLILYTKRRDLQRVCLKIDQSRHFRNYITLNTIRISLKYCSTAKVVVSQLKRVLKCTAKNVCRAIKPSQNVIICKNHLSNS